MGVRVVNGNTSTEDGWPLVDQDGCTWIVVPGTSVSLQIQSGVPARVLGAWVADWNAYVEPVYDADSASWTEGNSVLGEFGENNGSNHLGGTAVDVRWQSHPWKVRNGGLNAAQLATIDEMLDWYEGCIWWGGNWPDAYVDPMHSQLGSLSSGTVATYDNGPTPHIIDFIARKIRVDGFSTFRRGDAPAPPPLSRADGYAVLIIQEGQRRGITPRGIEIALATALVESNIQVYANPRVPESMTIPHDAVASDAYSVGIFQQQVRDTGNGWWWGDAATCMDPTSSAGLFYDRLSRLDYNGPDSPGSYAQTVQDSAYPDRYDARFGEAVDLYNRLVNTGPAEPGDDMAQVPQQEWDDFKRQWADFFSAQPTLSPFRPPGAPVFAGPAQFIRWSNGGSDFQDKKDLAVLGHQPTIDLLNQIAVLTDPDRQADAALARNVLAAAKRAWAAPTAVNNTAAAAPAAAPVDNTRELAAANAEIARLRDENARLQAAANQQPGSTPQPVSTEVATVGSTGDVAKTVIDAVEGWTDKALGLDTKQRAALTASMTVLQLNGNQQ